MIFSNVGVSSSSVGMFHHRDVGYFDWLSGGYRLWSSRVADENPLGAHRAPRECRWSWEGGHLWIGTHNGHKLPAKFLGRMLIFSQLCSVRINSKWAGFWAAVQRSAWRISSPSFSKPLRGNVEVFCNHFVSSSKNVAKFRSQDSVYWRFCCQASNDAIVFYFVTAHCFVVHALAMHDSYHFLRLDFVPLYHIAFENEARDCLVQNRCHHARKCK